MKCIKCKTVNVHNANYCKNCAYEFSKQEQEAAEKWTFIGIIKRMENFKEKVSFGWLLDHWAFKIGTIVGVLLIGIGCLFNNGSDFKLLEIDNYTGSYNEKLDEYYLYSKGDNTELNLYIPRKIDELNVEHYTDKGNLLSSTSFLVDADIILDCNGNGDYYILEAKHGNNDLDKIKIFIYQTKNGE